MWILLLALQEVILVNLCYYMCKNEWRGGIFMPPQASRWDDALQKRMKNAVNY